MAGVVRGDEGDRLAGFGSPERFVTVWYPQWPVVAAGCPPDQPAAVLASRRVVARTEAAAAEGVVVGQRRRQAQSRCPDVVLVDHDPARDAREFEPIVRAVIDVAPRLDVVEPGWICLAARGPSRYFGGDDAFAEHLVALLAELTDGPGGSAGAAVGIGVADGRFASGVAARLAARRGRPVVVEPGSSPSFCAPLPIGWLQTLGETSADLADLFVRLGLRRLGDLAELPEADVFGRFGRPGVHAHRLASGGDERPGTTEDPAPERRVTRSLDDPVAHSDAVVFVAKQLADELAGRLAADGRVCTRLVVQLETEHGERSERSWYRSAGLTASAMVERVRWQLEAWVRQPRGSDHTITAGVSLVRLLPEEIRADDGTQLGLWGGQSDADRRAARAIARLTTLTSESQVTVPVWQGGRMPADRYRWVAAASVDLDGRGHGALHAAGSSVGAPSPDAPGPIRSPEESSVGMAGPGHRSSGADRGPPWPGSLPAPSPATVYEPPIPIDVVDVDGKVVQVSGRGVVSTAPAAICGLSGSDEDGWRRGPRRAVRAWAGPWPVDQQWWEPTSHRRLARFQVVVDLPEGSLTDRADSSTSDGEHAVLVVAEHRRWWLAARYD